MCRRQGRAGGRGLGRGLEGSPSVRSRMAAPRFGSPHGAEQPRRCRHCGRRRAELSRSASYSRDRDSAICMTIAAIGATSASRSSANGLGRSSSSLPPNMPANMAMLAMAEMPVATAAATEPMRMSRWRIPVPTLPRRLNRRSPPTRTRRVSGPEWHSTTRVDGTAAWVGYSPPATQTYFPTKEK